MHSLSAVAALVSCALVAASCVQVYEPPEAEPGEASSTTNEPAAQGWTKANDRAEEPIGEAAQDWTKADCYARWKQNVDLCTRWGGRPECYAAVHALLVACLARAEG